MYGVVSSVHTGSLSVLCNAELVLASALLSSNTSLKVLLCVTEDVTKELSEL